MKKRPSLVLRDPVKLYETSEPSEIKNLSNIPEIPLKSEKIEENIVSENKIIKIDAIQEKMSPRIRQIWDYFCQKAKSDGEINQSFSLTRTEVMKEAGIGSTNTYRDALKKFQDLGLIEIELRPGVNSGSFFTFTENGMRYLVD